MENNQVFRATLQYLLPDGMLEDEIVIAFYPEDRLFTLALATREITETIDGFSADSPSDVRALKKLIEAYIGNVAVRHDAFDFIDWWAK